MEFSGRYVGTFGIMRDRPLLTHYVTDTNTFTLWWKFKLDMMS